MTHKLTFSLLLLCTLSHDRMCAQTGPGGVGTSATNVLWLAADRGISVTSGAVTNWADQSGNGFNAVPNAATARPAFVSSSVNGYPSLSFDGANDELWINDNASFDLTQWHFFIVPRVGVQKNYNAWLTKGNDSQENYEMLSFSDGNIHVPTYYTDASRSTPNAPVGMVTTTGFNIIEYSYSSAVGRDIYKNGASSYTDDESKTPATNNFSLYIGNERSTSGRFINASLAEVVMYNTRLNDAQRIIVNNYLAAKYGIALSANDIYTQDNAGSGNYDHDVAGIGRVDASNIQSDSQGSGIVRVLNPAGMGDGEYYLFGHDNGALGTYQTSDYPSGLQGRLVRVWRGNEVGTITSFNVRFDLTGLGPVTATQLRLLIDTDNDGTFADETPGGGGVISGATLVSGNIYQFAGVTGLNNNVRFTLGTTNIVSTPLPVSLKQFTAVRETDLVRVDWTTLEEKNNRLFSVERSKDGIDFELVGSRQGQFTSSGEKHYTIRDHAPFKEVSYYRLKQEDHDGTTAYSQVVVIPAKKSVLSDLQLYPNPCTTSFKLRCKACDTPFLHLEVTSSFGVPCYSIALHPGVDVMDVQPEPALPPGVYMVSIGNGSEVVTRRLIVE